jgi:hypothetical protein
MTIGFSPFLTADVDETYNLATQWSPALGRTEGNGTPDTRLELIRRRVAMGFYQSPAMATETARRILEHDSLDCP